MGRLRDAIGLGRSDSQPGGPPKTKAQLATWLAQDRKSKPSNYEEICRELWRLYESTGQISSTIAALEMERKTDHKEVVAQVVNVLQNIVNKKARAFGGEGEEFGLRNATEKDEVIWRRLVETSKLLQKLKTIDRGTNLLRRMFVRITYDEHRDTVRLTLYRPEDVFLEWSDPDAPSLDHANIGLRAVSVNDGKADVGRYEIWTGVVEGDGAPDAEFYTIATSGEGYSETAQRNPYTHPETGRPMLPIVSFGLLDEDLSGYFVEPDEQLQAMQTLVNVALSDLRHTEKLQGSGLPVWEPVAGESPKAPPPVLKLARGIISRLPLGYRINFLNPGAPLESLRGGLDDYISKFEAAQDVPAGSAFNNGSETSSALALLVKNQPLLEHREDSILMYGGSVEEVLLRMKAVYNEHTPTENRISDGAVPYWKPGRMALPMEKTTSLQIEDAEIRQGVRSPVDKLMKEHGLSEKEAREKLAQNRLDAELRPAPLPGGGLGLEDNPDPLGQARGAPAPEEDEEA